MQGALEPDAPPCLSYYVSSFGFERFGDQWKDIFIDRVLTRVADSSVKAKLLLGWPATQSTWDYVAALGSEVRDQYWRHMGRLPLESPVDDLLFSVDQLQRVERDIDVLCMLHKRSADLPSNLLVDLLSKGSRQVSDGIKRHGNMLSYYIALTFKELRARSDAEKLEIARLEYAYFPILRHDREPLTIYSLLASDPEMFVDVLSHVFQSKKAAEEQVLSDEMKARARISYDVLSAFTNVPGLRDGKIDVAELSSWVTEARQLAAEKGLDEIGDQRIGFVLAHAPQDDEEAFWPPSPVCQVIETAASVQIERGFEIECFNKRGVFRKGLNEGGDQERRFAETYKGWADATRHFPRTSAMLTAISADWNRHAESADVEAEKSKFKH